MTAPEITVIPGRNPHSAGLIQLSDDAVPNALTIVVMKNGHIMVSAQAARITATDLQRLTDTVRAVEAGTYQPNPQP